uniref:Uncharacterized protein n=1 Tax=Helianthus annuus TaxID=4232 RepID=A0A251UYG9_HELAN
MWRIIAHKRGPSSSKHTGLPISPPSTLLSPWIGLKLQENGWCVGGVWWPVVEGEKIVRERCDLVR